MSTMRTLLLASAVFAGLFGSLAAVPVPDSTPVPDPAPGPDRAFCKTVWLFATPCAEVSTTVAQQIQASSPEYMLVLGTSELIKANHTSLGNPEGEFITIVWSPTKMTNGCRATAMSTSLGFTSLLDDGLNYCNLFNLLLASKLNSSPGFMEITNEWACLGHDLATCKA